MRKEKDIYYKHLDQASKSVYKANGGVDPLTNVERHVYDWRNLYYEEGERGPKQNLVDIVEYRTQEGGADGQTYHHHFTQFYCASDFFNNAKGQAKSSALDYVGLSGVANYFMGKDSPRRMERELVQAIAGNKLESLGIAQDRFDAIIELSTKVANRPVETADIFKGNSLLTGAYVRAHIEATHRRKAQLNSTMKP